MASEDNFSCIYLNLNTHIRNFILELLVNAGVLFLLAAALPSVSIKSYGTAIGVALVVGILNATFGWLMRLPLNLITFGLLSFVVTLVVTAVIIRIADKLFSGFEVKGWTAAFLPAACIAVVGTILNYFLHPRVEEDVRTGMMMVGNMMLG